MSARSGKNNGSPLKAILTIIVIMWLVLFACMIAPGIRELGIRPRTVIGFVGIFTAPFIHADMFHLIANTIWLFILGLIFLRLEKDRASYIILPIYFLSGFGPWIIGRSGSVHIGASGIVYGLLGYLLTIGFFRRHFLTILLSAVLFFLFGGALWGILPVYGGAPVSWEGHLSGFAAGILTAWSEGGPQRKRRR